MVSVAKAVVYEDAVMVEFLNAAVAKVAVVCVFWPQSLAGHTNIVEMVVLLYQFVKQLLKIRLFLDVTWIDHC